MNQRQNAIDIYLNGVEAVRPNRLIQNIVSVNGNTLRIEHLLFDLSIIENIYIVGAGKACASMAQAIETILGQRITGGHVITKYAHALPLLSITLTEAGHPIPDENGVRGTEYILSIVKSATERDLIICLISGGGSALLIDVPEGCTLDDVKSVNRILLKAGANIREINCIRKHISSIKGGLLAKVSAPSKLVSLILSDVIGDPLDVIASGPTVADPTTFYDAISIINKYGIETEMPTSILKVIRDGLRKSRPETLKESDGELLYVNNFIIGNNVIALNAAKDKAESLGYKSVIITNQLEGELEDVASYIFNTVKNHVIPGSSVKKCLLFAGEPTIKVTGKGTGGRNQHLALILSGLIKDIPEITILSGGTDGTDGPTDAAGAVVDSLTWKHAMDLHLDIEQYIENFDSYNFFKQEGGLIITGATQTNVMDLMIVLI